MTRSTTWEDALNGYKYSVDLPKFADASAYPGWFESNIDPGNRRQTMDFEARFRAMAPLHLEAWAQVVFWKNYSMAFVRDKITRRVLDLDVRPADLWLSCRDYVSTPSLRKFRVFRDQLFQTPTVATAATFPAFMRPKQFPMVDRRITAWASRNGCLHSYAEVDGPELRCVPALGKDVLQDHHWPFIESWIAWCQCEFLIRRVRRIEQQVLSDTTSSRRSESERARAGDGRTRRQVSVAGRSRAAIGHDYGGEGHFSPQRERQQTWGASGDRESYVLHVIDHISHRRPGWNSRQQDPTPLDAALPIIGYQSSCTLGCG